MIAAIPPIAPTTGPVPSRIELDCFSTTFGWITDPFAATWGSGTGGGTGAALPTATPASATPSTHPPTSSSDWMCTHGGRRPRTCTSVPPGSSATATVDESGLA